MVNINKNFVSTVNTTRATNRKITHIAIHYTTDTSSNQGKAMSVAKFFSRGTRQGSADFIVDDIDIVQYNQDIKNRFCWAIGDARAKSKTTSLSMRLNGKINNSNVISIEMCSSKVDKTKVDSPMYSDWYITDKVLKNAQDLTKYLMTEYNIPLSNVVMHHEITGKICPAPFCRNEGDLVNWYKFKQGLVANVGIEIQGHVQNIGWQNWVGESSICGIIGQGLRLEAIKINPKDKQIRVKAHIQDIGWVDYGLINVNTVIGTVGQGKRIEALEVSGAMVQLHIQDIGWADSYSNSQGTFGLAKRIEAIKIKS